MNFVGLRSAGSVGSTCTCVMIVAHAPRTVRAAQRVLERLLDHVADPAGGRGDEHAEWQRTRLVARDFVPHQLVADLRTVAVDDAHAPSGERQLDDRAEALARMAELIVDRRPFAGRRERVAAERDDRRPAMPVRASRTYSRWRPPGELLPSATPSASNARPNATQSPRCSASRIAA